MVKIEFTIPNILGEGSIVWEADDTKHEMGKE